MKEPTKTTRLYNGRIVINFYANTHQYLIDNFKHKPISVTAATGIVDKSRPLIYWAIGLMRDDLLNKAQKKKKITADEIMEASKLHAQFKKEAADKGTLVHNWAEQYIKFKLGEIKYPPEIPKDEQVQNGALAFLKWENENKVKFLASEKIVYSAKFDYVGIMDCEAVINGKRSVVDFKTSKGIYNEMRYQVAAYRQADEEESKKPYDGNCYIVRFDKETADFEVYELDEYMKDFCAFVACLNVRKRENELAEKNKKAA